MAKLQVESQKKETIVALIDSLLTALYQQKNCGIDTVSTDIEIGSLEEILKCVHQL